MKRQIPLFASRTVKPSVLFIASFNRTSAFFHEMGKLGIVGLLGPSILSECSYEG